MDPDRISLSKRLWLWTAAWGIAGVATVISTEPSVLIWAFLFPAGLLIVVPDNVPNEVGRFLFFLTYAFYAVLTIIGLAQTRRMSFYFSLGILCVLLALNVVGCHIQVRKPFNPGG